MPCSKAALHVVPHETPAGDDVTVPLPATWIVRVCWMRLKVATTCVLPDTVTTHGPEPEHPPPTQRTKVLPSAAVADNATIVPLVHVEAHTDPHVRPTGFDVTVPLPVPLLRMVNV